MTVNANLDGDIIARASLKQDAKSLNLVEFWEQRADVELLAPRNKARSYRWRWADIEPRLRVAAKTVPIEAFFRKIVAVRERLRVLEQRINTHPKLADEDRLQLQDYITRAYGSLTTFNVLFADAEDRFVGTKGSEDD